MSLTRRAVLKGALATTVGAVTGVSAYGLVYERHRLGLTDAELQVSGLPQALDGFRIAFLTDIHHSAIVPPVDVTRAVEMANAAKPDLVVLGGDFVTLGDRTFVQPVAELLAPLRAPHGVIAILGNHDDDRDMPAALTRVGVAVLRDQRTRLTVNGESIALAGIRFWTRKASEIAHVVAGAEDPVLLLAHDPRRLTEAAALNVAAVLSGHTHGGQIVMPGLGAIGARKFPITEGNGSLDNTTIFVSRGVGTVYVPVRINCPPEVALVTLRRRSAI